MAISKEDLLKRSFGVEKVEVRPGEYVEVRPLTRSEALAVQGKEMGVLEMERLLVSTAMVSPQLTAEEVEVWQDNSAAGEIEPVAKAIARLSGMEAQSPKEAYADFHEQS